jgi:hypothetical protein
MIDTTFKFDLSNSTIEGGGVNDLVNANNIAVTSALVSVNAIAGSLGNGTYRLFNYSGTMSGSVSSMGLGGPLTNMRQTATLSAATPHQTNLVVSGTPAKSLVWTGAATNNWKLKADANFVNENNIADQFFNLDAVTFNDSSTNNANVVIQGEVDPGSITVNAARDYIFSGTGSIRGHTGIYKTGPGTLTIANTGSNNFDGVERSREEHYRSRNSSPDRQLTSAGRTIPRLD